MQNHPISSSGATPTVPTAADCLLAGLAGSGLAGLLIGRLTLQLSPDVHQQIKDTVMLMVDFGLIYALLGAVGGLAAGLALALLGRLGPPAGLRRFLGVGAVAALLLGPLLYVALLPQVGISKHLLANLAFGGSRWRLLAVGAGVALLLALVGHLLRPALRVPRRLVGGGERRSLVLLWSIAAVGVVGWTVLDRPAVPATAVMSETQVAQIALPESRPDPVVLLVIDGAELDTMIRPMVEAGELPTFKRLMETSTWAHLASIPPGRSHSIWTSIITGKRPDQHGIRNFTTFRVPGVSTTIDELPLHTGLNFILPGLWERIPGVRPLQAPYTSNMRKVEALWNIVSRFYPVGVYRWLVTWPAEPVDGFYVSGGMRWAQFVYGFAEELERGLPRAAVYPPDALEGLDLPHEREVTWAELEPFVGKGYENARQNKLIQTLEEVVDDPTGVVLPELMAKYKPLFTAAAFYPVDSEEHHFTQFMNKGGPFSGAVAQVYRNTDQRLGDFIAGLSPNTNLVVISDHGFDFVNGHHIFAPPGIFFATGPAFDVGREAVGLSVYDIAPLVLRLLDLPVPEDMEAAAAGHYRGALSAAFAAAHPERRIATYETGRQQSHESLESPIDQEMGDVLKSLGYVN